MSLYESSLVQLNKTVFGLLEQEGVYEIYFKHSEFFNYFEVSASNAVYTNVLRNLGVLNEKLLEIFPEKHVNLDVFFQEASQQITIAVTHDTTSPFVLNEGAQPSAVGSEVLNLGLALNNQPLLLPIAEAGNMLVFCEEVEVKNAFMDRLLLELAEHNSCVLVDLSPSKRWDEFSTKISICDSKTSLQTTIEILNLEMNQRELKSKEAAGFKMYPILLFFNELGEIASLNKLALKKILELFEKGPDLGIYCLCFSERITQKCSMFKGIEMLDTIICFRTNCKKTSRLLLEDEKACSSLKTNDLAFIKKAKTITKFKALLKPKEQ